MKRTIIIRDAPEGGDGNGARGGGGAGGGGGGAAHVTRVVLSLACALVADGLQWLIPPLWVICDGAMVLALLLIWGWRWEIAVVIIPEVIPGFDLFPTWVLFVGYLAFVKGKNGKGGGGSTAVTPGESRPMKRVGPP